MFRSLLDRMAKTAPQAGPGLLQQSMPRLLADYGGLMHQHPNAVLDSAKLPASKAELKSVLRMAWQIHTGAEQRAVIERGYRHLARFQDGVGETAIPLGDAENRAGNETMRPWLEKIEAEATALATEFDEFKRRCSKQ